MYDVFWKKPLEPMLRELIVDSKTFQYLPAEVLEGLRLNLLHYREPILLFREEYDTALKTLESWKKPLVTGAVVTGYSGIGT